MSTADIGALIARTRSDLGITQLQAAELAGISYRPIYNIEAGRSIRLETLLSILDALGLELKIEHRGGMTSDQS